jgi:hypothetical protein
MLAMKKPNSREPIESPAWGAVTSLGQSKAVHDDLSHTVAKPKANSVAILPIPENYYDDLEARVDLSREQLDVLRANNILYDKDDTGSILYAVVQRFFLCRDR